jgi:hypothetical protein
VGTRLVAIVIAAIAALALSPLAGGYETPRRLNAVAMVYTLGVGEIRCPSVDEWNADFASSFGHAYTHMASDYAVLSPLVCEGALGVGSAEVADWKEALGVLVLVHESFHLRRWRWRRDEGKVECQAMTYFRDAAMRLGSTPTHAHDLYAYAIALHFYKATIFPQYRDDGCVITPWAPPQ